MQCVVADEIEAANPNCLGYVFEYIQYPIAKCGTEAQGGEFGC